MRRNKMVLEQLARFTNDIHGYMMSGGTVKPVIAPAGGGRPATPAGTTATGGATATAGTAKKL
jgi:biopolymer transport protein ExbB